MAEAGKIEQLGDLAVDLGKLIDNPDENGGEDAAEFIASVNEIISAMAALTKRLTAADYDAEYEETDG